MQLNIPKAFRRKAALTVTAAMALVGFSATTASANWSSYISSWTDGDRSRKWTDSGTYSQVQFRSCFAQYGTTEQVVVKMWKIDTWTPNDNLGSKTFTNCFNGSSSWSNGQWTNVPTGEHTLQFEADKVAQGGSCCLLNVAEVYVDTSQAD
ncbi:hypothetical protein ABZ023_08090 [Streptomyces sp. NPDC006367]|uniref:hypothetical protein n=1 Tax=unclassified Streptomyces TaxID=2593676 RepID=UPI0033A3F3B4